MREIRAWRFQVDGEAHVHHPHGRFRTADAEQVRAAVLAGLGITQAPGWLFAPELASGEVIAVLDDFQPPPQPLNLVHPVGRRPAAKVRALMDFIVEELPRNDFLN